MNIIENIFQKFMPLVAKLNLSAVHDPSEIICYMLIILLLYSQSSLGVWKLPPLFTGAERLILFRAEERSSSKLTPPTDTERHDECSSTYISMLMKAYLSLMVKQV